MSPMLQRGESFETRAEGKGAELPCNPLTRCFPPRERVPSAPQQHHVRAPRTRAVPARMRPSCHDSGIDRSTVTTDVAFAGLDEEEARRRAAEGRVNAASEDTSRTVREILRSNILTRFNALLGSLLVVI